MPTNAMDYEALRLENIKKNNDILASLGLETNVFTGPSADTSSQLIPKSSKKPAKKVKAPPQKRDKDAYQPKEEDGDSASSDEDEDEDDKRKVKVAKTKAASRPSLGTRSSARNAGKAIIDYSGDNFKNAVSVPTVVSRKRKSRKDGSEIVFDDLEDGELPRHRLGKRTQNPKVFGHIPGVRVGTMWELRMHCSTAGVHAPPVSGISGNKEVGAWSIALSGGYEDDIDLGYGFTFTGAGGRDLRGTKDKPKNLRTAPQSCDQSWDNPLNAALKKSSETHKPVRVIRGFKLHSKYAPVEGYRYDGLYTVEKAWMERGINKQGFKVCKYAFKRVPGQPPLPERDLEAEARGDTTDAETDEAGSEDDGCETEQKTEASEEDGDAEEDEEMLKADECQSGVRSCDVKTELGG